MPLTDEQKQAIREEEFFRDQVRKDLAGPRDASFLARVATFFDTKAGFWILTTALAGLTATGFTELRNIWIAQRSRVAPEPNGRSATPRRCSSWRRC